MIYWFSGTGNSQHVARELATKTNDSLAKMTDSDTSLACDDETLGFVFPIYAWGVPPIVLSFISQLKMTSAIRYVWAVMTCGDEIGAATKMLEKALLSKGLRLDACFSVIMPNTYILLPGFDTDSKALEDKKIKESAPRISEIADLINHTAHVYDLQIGSLPNLKTRLVYPLFKHWGIFKSKWHANEQCTRCRLCAKECPTHNISLESDGIKWGNKCVSCLSCIHRCPHRAIDYGNITHKKGRYHFSSKRE